MSRLTFSEGNHQYRLDRKWVPGVTGITKGLTKPDGLIAAAVKLCGTYALNHVDDLKVLDPDVWLAAVLGAHQREWNRRRDDGTMLHSIAESLVMGEPMPTVVGDREVPDDVRRMAGQLAGFYDAFDVEPVLREAMGFHDGEQYAGTFDVVADVAGTRWLLDYKTGQSGIWGETALQLCAYRHLTHYVDPDDGTDREMSALGIERTGAVWIRPDFAELIPTRSDDATQRAFLDLMRVLDFARPRKNLVGDPVPVPKPVEP